MNVEVASKTRATIIRIPDAGPGLLVSEGSQLPFVLDSSEKVTGIWVVDQQQLAKESLSQFSEAAQRRAWVAASIATRSSGSLAARLGKFTLAVTALLWIAFFWMPAVKINAGFFARPFTLWQILGLDLENNSLQSHGPFSLLGIAALLAPLVAPYLRTAQTRYLNAAPLAYFILASLHISSMFESAGASFPAARGATNMFSIQAGAYILVIASIILAVRAVSAKANAGSK